jgi:hypothetical protein
MSDSRRYATTTADVLLTVHVSINLVINQLDEQILTKVK